MAGRTVLLQSNISPILGPTSNIRCTFGYRVLGVKPVEVAILLGITLSDLLHRRRQFLIAVVGAGLVFAMTLLLAGISAGFRGEIRRTVQGTGASYWVIARSGPASVSELSPISESGLQSAMRSAGIRRASPIIFVPQAAISHGSQQDVILIGVVRGGLGVPALVSGRTPMANDETVVDASLGLHVGDGISVSGRTVRVVGTVTGRTLLGGTPDIYVPLPTAQAIVFGGHRLASAMLTQRRPGSLPRDLQAVPEKVVEAKTVAQMAGAVSSIDSFRVFMWIVATVIVATLVYVAALERTRDFAVLKALGTSSVSLFGGLATQAVVVSLAAAALGSVIANFMTGLFSQPVEILPSAFILLPLSALIIGLLASLVALRRAVKADPAQAFAG
jgi:putative ABC transport system permease protein